MSSGNQRYINTAGTHDITMNDDFINVSTSVGAITLVFPNIRDSGAIPTNKVWFVNDVDDMAATNNVTIVASATNPVTELNGGTSVVLDTNGFSAEIVPSGYYNYMVNSGTSEGGMTGSGTLNYVAKFTPSGTVLGNSQLFDNGSSVGLGTTTPTTGTKFHVYRAVNDFLYEVKIENPTNGASAVSSMLIQSDNGKMEFGQLSTLFTTYTGYGQTGDTFIRSGVGARNLNITTDASNVGKILFFSRLNATTDAASPSLCIDGSRSGFNRLAQSDTVVSIKGDATSSNYALKVDNSAATPLMCIRNDGGVGIGTITPTGLLHVVTSGGGYQASSNLEATANTAMIDYTILANGNTGISMGIKGSSVNAFPAYGANNSGHIYQGVGVVGFNFVTSADNTPWRFYNGNADGTTSVLSVAASKVGIGIDTATSKLQVVGLIEYADNAAALGAGLTAGAFYIRTAHGLDVVV